MSLISQNAAAYDAGVDNFVTAAWDALGVIWRVLLVLIPLAAVVWAVTRGRRADATAFERNRREVESRQTDVPPMNFPPFG